MPIIVELTANIIDSLLLIHFTLGYHNKTLKQNKHSIIFSILIFLTLSISSFHTVFSSAGTIVSIILAFALSFTIRGRKISNAIIIPTIYYIVVSTVNVVAISTLKLITRNSADLLIYGTSLRYILVVSTKLISIVSIIAILKTKRREISFKRGDLLLYIAFPLISFIILLSLGNIIYTNKLLIASPWTVLSLSCIVILNFATLYHFEKITKANKEFYELEILRSQLSYEKDKYIELQDLYEQIRAVRHDFSKHITFIEQLLENESYDEAYEYIKTMQNSGEINNVLIQSGNRSLDFIINSKVSANSDIKFSIIGSVAILPKEAFDLVVLIGNILDNAIEAARNSREQIVEIQFLATDYYQNIICRNSIDSSVLRVNPTLKTTKKNTEYHGLGVKSIKKIAEKYLGLVDFFEEKGQFCVQVSLPICEIEKVALSGAEDD